MNGIVRVHLARAAGAIILAFVAATTCAQSTPATPPSSQVVIQPAKPADGSHALTIGDAAPSIESVRWISGSPVHFTSTPETTRSKVTVISFWSAWSGASREALGVLGRIRREFAEEDVRIAAICVWPRDKNEDGAALVAKWSQRWPLSFGVDVSGDAAGKWLDAAGRTSVPMTFVVDAAGNIVWIGSPFEGLATVTRRAVRGTLNVETTRRQLARSARLDEVAGKNMVPAALLLTEELLSDDPELFGYLAGFKFRLLLRQHASPLQAFSFAREAVRSHLKDNPEELNALACAVLDHKDRDVSLALDAAQRAAKLLDEAQDPDASVLDTLARAQFEHGEADAAVTTQTRAVSLADEGRMKKTLQKRLDRYKATADARVGPPAAAGQ